MAFQGHVHYACRLFLCVYSESNPRMPGNVISIFAHVKHIILVFITAASRNMLIWNVTRCCKSLSWLRHQMETFSPLLAICVGNSSVTGEFPAQLPVTRSFDVFFTGHLCGEFISHRWIPRTKASDAELWCFLYWPFVRGIHRSPVNSPHKGQWRGALMFSLICSWINGWVNNREAGDLRRHRTDYDVTVMC